MSSDTDQTLTQDELTVLKARADLMGISYHPSIGLEKLREKINAANSDEAVKEPVQVASQANEETLNQKRSRLKKEAMELVRIRVTCMNPAKAEWEGEIVTVGNSAVGSITKFIPFNADAGWHVPRIIYQQLVERQCQIFVTVNDSRGNKTRKGKLIKEFAIEVMPPLTPAELQDLAQQQAMAKAID
jgi:uncharacterized protein (UPF0212 family)